MRCVIRLGSFFFFLFICLTKCAYACPLVKGLIDFNCNQRLKFLVTGDSIVFGTGDSSNGGRGGYVKRLADFFKPATVINAGVYAITTGQLLRRFKSGQYRKYTKNLDLVLIDLGRNDCRDYEQPQSIVRTLKRLADYFEKELRTVKSDHPFVVIATEIPARNTYRRACIEEVNRILLTRKRKSLPVHLRFDTLPASILSADGIHPDSSGYDDIARVAKNFIKAKLQELQSELRPDSDADGLYDYFELNRYSTDPLVADTDSDGLSDGAEISAGTDPLNP